MKKTYSAAHLAGVLLACSAGPLQADGPPFPSAEWTLREANNYSRTQDATAIQADPQFQQRWQQQSLINAQEYLARERNDAGWNSRGNACKEWAEPCTGDPYRYPGWDAFYAAEGELAPVIFFDAQGARLSGRLWAPADSAPGDRLPVVVINNGSVQVPETAYWWAAQLLVRNGYVVLSFDPRGQGRSDNRTPDGEAGSNSNPSVFVTNLVDAVDFVLSRPDAPYAHNQTYTRAVSTPYNPFWNRIDAGRIGLAGHSLGARGVSVVQGLQPWPGTSGPDNPVDVIVAWDNLAAAGAAGEYIADIGEYRPRVPAMGQSADYWLAPQPKLSPPDPLEKSPGVELWRSAGVPVYQVQIQGGTHYEWSLMPSLPTSAWEPGGDGGWGQPLVRHYTLAWFDRWLKQPGEPGYADADARLLDDAAWLPRLSFYYLSSRDFPGRDGRQQVCEDIAAGCAQDSAARQQSVGAGGATGAGMLLLAIAAWVRRRRTQQYTHFISIKTTTVMKGITTYAGALLALGLRRTGAATRFGDPPRCCCR